MEIITRQEAMQRGLKNYFTGKPCKKGHVAKRYTSASKCVECAAYEKEHGTGKRAVAKKKGKNRSYGEAAFGGA